ncbi:UNVERIFIED_CONTAM: hypothetical protein FKN15_040777 [Acipenser sinensis]
MYSYCKSLPLDSACNCSGRSEDCHFDAELYRGTGHGGHCVNCRDGTAGPNCERCKENFHRSSPKDACLPCNCSVVGSSSLQCGGDGNCICKLSVTGEKCDSCQPGYYSLTEGGCRPCACHPAGSVGLCNPLNGQCSCKENVEGYQCDRCKPGTFNLDSQNPAGCTSCFCYGHSAACTSAVQYSAFSITSDFTEACNCSPMGSVTMQCHGNGTCLCREGFVGYKCDQCKVNYFHSRATHQCEECPVCYGLVRDEAAKLKEKLQALEEELKKYDCQSHRGYEHYPVQREGSLSNSLEDLLAMQNARDAFLNQFMELETSVRTIQERLSNISRDLNCSGAGNDKHCSALSDTGSSIQATQGQLQLARETLDNMVIPHDLPREPNKWTILVNESQVLAVRYFDMHEAKANLTESVEETLTEAKKTYSSVQRINTEIAEVLTNITDSHRDLTARASESQGLALTSVVKGKEVDAEASALLKELEGMKKTWSRKQTQTKVAVKKMRTVKEKIVVDAKKKTKQAVNTVTPAVSNSTQANATAREAQRLATEASADAKAALKQTEKSGRMTTELNSTVSAVLHEVAAQEMKAAELKRDMREMEEIAGNMGDVREDMKTAKRSLESYALVLKDLLAKLETSQVNERFESLLNETETQLRILQLGVQSEGLGLRIQTLQEAVRQQESQMKEMEKDIAEILEEKINLEDIVQNFPEGCFNRPQTGRQ